ncbi:MAG TPA: HAD-IA family hydrolase [Propionibacteriaceae bacterium]|nr:HAD-IA family hydrolase [Propionibacteriaceae bacterium]
MPTPEQVADHVTGATLDHVDPAAIDAVLFDMDGTLLDSHAAVERAWTAVAERNGLDLADVLRDMHGLPAATTMRRLLPHADDATFTAELGAHAEQECTDLDGIVPLPGAQALIAFLAERRIPWCVVTSAQPRLASARLGAAGFAAPVLVTPADVANGKPAPDSFLEGARRLGVPPERCLAVEDSPGGLVAARASGAIVVDVGPGGVTLVALLERLRGQG